VAISPTCRSSRRAARPTARRSWLLGALLPTATLGGLLDWLSPAHLLREALASPEVAGLLTQVPAPAEALRRVKEVAKRWPDESPPAFPPRRVRLGLLRGAGGGAAGPDQPARRRGAAGGDRVGRLQQEWREPALEVILRRGLTFLRA